MRKRVCSVQFNIQQHCEEGLVKPKYLQNEITLSELNFEFILNEEGLVKPKYLQNEITLSELNFEFILKVF